MSGRPKDEEDLESLIIQLRDAAGYLCARNTGNLYPIAGMLNRDGEFVPFAVEEELEFPASADVYRNLEAVITDAFSNHEILAAAIAVAVTIGKPGQSKADGIRIDYEHESGLSGYCVSRYSIVDDELQFEDPELTWQEARWSSSVAKLDVAGLWQEIGDRKSLVDALLAVSSSAESYLRAADILTPAFNLRAPNVDFEIGRGPDGAIELIVSAGGIGDLSATVRDLVAAAPKLDGWRVVAFKPRRDIAHKIQLGRHTCDISKTRVEWIENCDRLDLRLYVDVRPSAPQQLRLHLAYLALDIALGEYDVMTRIGSVAAEPLFASRGVEGTRTLDELTHEIDRRYRSSKH